MASVVGRSCLQKLRHVPTCFLGSHSFTRTVSSEQFVNERMIKAVEEVISTKRKASLRRPRKIGLDRMITFQPNSPTNTEHQDINPPLPHSVKNHQDDKEMSKLDPVLYHIDTFYSRPPQSSEDGVGMVKNRFTLNQKQAHRMFYNHKEYERLLLKIDTVSTDHNDFIEDMKSTKHGFISPSKIVKLLQIICACPRQIQQKLFHDPALNVPTILFRSVDLFSVYEICQVLVASATLSIAPNELFVAKMANRCSEMLNDGIFDLQTALSVSDAWRQIGRSVPTYNEKLFELCNQNAHHLSKMQFVQLLYLIGENRQHQSVLIKKLEALSHKFIHRLRPDEISAVCLGFFKSQSTISSTKLLMAFGDAVTEELKTINEFSLASILKCYRYAGTAHKQFFEKVSKHISKNASHLSAVSLMHIAFSFASLRFFNKEFLDTVATEAVLNASKCRLKDLSKFIWCYSTLNYEPSNSDEFYATLIAEMKRRKKEFYEFPYEMLNAVTKLAFLNKYDAELLNIIFSAEFLNCLQDGKEEIHKDRDLYSIHNAVAIDFPEYSGTNLPLSLIDGSQSRIESSWVVDEDFYSRDIKQILNCLDELVGQYHYKYHRILSHFKTLAIEIKLNYIGQPISFQTGSVSASKGSAEIGIKLDSQIISAITDKDGVAAARTESNHETPAGPSPNEEHSRLAVLIHSQAQYRLNSHDLLGLYIMKLRHLQKSGYNVIQIHYHEWSSIRFWSKDDQIKYLEQKIFQ